MYQGKANTGKGARNFGAAYCEDGTFCRNPTPENDRYPYCINKVDGKKFYCRIALCGEHQPKEGFQIDASYVNVSATYKAS